MKDPLLTIRIPAEDLAALKELAKADAGRSVSSLARKYLRDGLIASAGGKS